ALPSALLGAPAQTSLAAFDVASGRQVSHDPVVAPGQSELFFRPAEFLGPLGVGEPTRADSVGRCRIEPFDEQRRHLTLRAPEPAGVAGDEPAVALVLLLPFRKLLPEALQDGADVLPRVRELPQALALEIPVFAV